MSGFWKNKTVIAYIALEHHTRFIIPVMERLSSQGARVKYVVGQAERSQEVTAIGLGLDYVHIFDYLSQGDLPKIQNHYHRLRQTFANSLKNDFLFSLQPATVTDKTLHSTAMEFTGLENLIRMESPDLCFALHELNRWGKMFAFQAKQMNVPFITLQEGLTYGLDFGYSGHAQYSTLNLVWGERVKNKMVSFEAPASKIIPVGNTHLAREITFQAQQDIRKRKRQEFNLAPKQVALLILSSILPPPDLFMPIFNAAAEHDALGLIVKFHPACKKPQMDQWIEAIPENRRGRVMFLHTQQNMYDLISAADVCVLGQRSTTGLESIAFGKPLVKLASAYTPDAPYSFVDQGVAVKMDAKAFADAWAAGTDFSTMIDPIRRDLFLKQELIDTENAIENVCTLFQSVIQANTTPKPKALDIELAGPEKKWSFLVQVSDNPDIFLAQLEAIAMNSEGHGSYETLFFEPRDMAPELSRVLDSLTGDIKRIPVAPGAFPAEMINASIPDINGAHLVFLEKNLAPLKGWLKGLNQGFSTHGNGKILGGRICSPDGHVAHAGMVVDHNNTPVSAYLDLDIRFQGALKERPFQMVDYCLALPREQFAALGGLSAQAGPFSLLDLCLKATENGMVSDPVIYLPDVELIFLERPKREVMPPDAAYFYGRWHGRLIESQSRLHEADCLTLQDLAQAKQEAAAKSIRPAAGLSPGMGR